ncbi:MAG: aminotransferase class I/II-fold pyridoxal phosphate-dependent enzyme, partial [Candidatus Hydrothermarchaeaceae archaeon]
NVLAQKAAIGALDEPEFLKRTVKTVKKEREFLLRELSGIDGVKVYPSKANFLLLRTEKMVIANELMKKGVIIRDCSSTRGLDARYLRVSVGTRGENETFLACLKEILH